MSEIEVIVHDVTVLSLSLSLVLIVLTFSVCLSLSPNSSLSPLIVVSVP